MDGEDRSRETNQETPGTEHPKCQGAALQSAKTTAAERRARRPRRPNYPSAQELLCRRPGRQQQRNESESGPEHP